MGENHTTAPEGEAKKVARDKARAQAEKRLGTTLAGRYKIESLLGLGGMGSVYVAVQEPLGRKVALKCIRSVLTDDDLAVKRFIQEARAVSQLQHPNIVTLHDFGQDDDGTLFIAMELLDGESLRERVERDGPLGVGASIAVVRAIASALAQAHAAGIIHRDLKPDNAMLTELVGHGQAVKVVDFGVAKLAQEAADEALTGTGHVVGTPGYIAPEQMNCVLDDPRSDLYALGVLWYEVLCGASPFEGETPMKKAFQHLTEEAPRPSERRPGLSISRSVEDLLMRLLAKAPEERPASAEALLAELSQLDADITAVPMNTEVALPPSAPTIDGTLPPQTAETSQLPAEVDDEEFADAMAAIQRRPPLWISLAGLFVVGAALGFAVVYTLAG